MSKAVFSKVVFCLVVLLFISNARAASYLLVSPQNYTRGTGAPVTETLNFTARDTVSTYTINLYNGGLADNDVTGDLVSASVINLNGVSLFTPDEFNQTVVTLSKTINVNANNVLEVTLDGKPGGLLTIEIVGEDNVPPQIDATITPLANAASWHKSQVLISYTCDDGQSGIAICPDAQTITVEGANQVISATASDVAGNESTATVTLNIDLTAPEITSSADPVANAYNWNNTAVTISYNCLDALSGVASCSPPVTLSAEGAAQIVTGEVTDTADNNASVSHTVNIDLTPPQISTSLSAPANASDWYKNDVTVNFNCSDALSGIVECPTPVTLSTEGASQIIEGSVADKADNTSSASVSLNLDKTPPLISSSAVPLPNAKGWNNNEVTVSYACQDSLSGVASCSPPVAVPTEGANQTVTGNAADVADNAASVTHTLNIDLTQPTIATSLSAPANAAGWHKEDVTTTFTCDDNLSGVVECPAPNTLSTEGANQVISGAVSDNADNSNSTSVTLNLDKTPPSLTSAAAPLPNTKGWNNSAVTVSYDCQDSLSGVASCSFPETVSTEGENQTVTGNGADVADNTASVDHTLNVDLTQPEISASLSAPANGAGWHNADVTTTFTCSDNLSGVVECPQPNTLSQEGMDQVISGSVSDNADNTASTSVTINLDKTAPVVTASPTPLPNANGWHNTAVTVNFDCQDSLSFVAECTPLVAVNLEGANQNIVGQGTDFAGNSAQATQVLNIDLTVPSITAQLSIPPNAAGWHNSDLQVNYTCTDALSGIATCPPSDSVLTEGANQVISATTVDLADNSADVSVTLNLDKTLPVITASTDPLANANGWHKSAVTVNFTCDDMLSGVAQCSEPQSLTQEGANQTVTGQSTDVADNSAEVTQSVSIDLTPPTIDTQFSATANAAGWYKTPVTLTFTCNDLLSGVQTCPDPVSVTTDIQGQQVSVTASDMADNTVNQQHVINLDLTAPQITFLAPEAGVELATLQPVIEMTVSDNLLLDEASLVLTVNGQAFPGTCVINGTNAVCTPTSNFPRGAIQVQATIADVAGNTVTVTHDFRIQEDRDNDGVPDVDDAFPDDPTEWADLDGDGIGDNSDPDVDGDGINNDYETQVGTDPRDPSSVPPDQDGDGIPDSIDDDVDGDGVPNATDAFPTDPAEWSDLDGDGIGDNADLDRDGDGFTNEEEILEGSNPDDPNDVPGLRIGFSAAITSTENQFITLEGTVNGDTIDRVYLTSDQFAGSIFSATVTNDTWASRVALKVGTNTITAHVEGNGRDQAEAQASVIRTEPPPVVELLFDTPANNSLVETADVVVTGRVISETVVEAPQVNINNFAATVSQGASPTEFNFNAAISLYEGTNNIVANAVVAGQALQQRLTLTYQPESAQVLPPAVSITSPLPGKTLTADTFVLSALIQSDGGLSSVSINGQPANLIAPNQIEQSLAFAGQTQLDVVIVATDNLNQTSTLNASYSLDVDSPVVVVDALQAYPTENTVTENPYNLTGTVTDGALSQLTLNGQALALEPTATQNTYRFDADIAVPVGAVSSISLNAIDAAGNETDLEYLLVANSDVQIEWLTPADNSELLLEGVPQTITASARLSSVTGIGNVQLEIVDQGAAPVVMTLDTDIASGQITLPDTEGEYTLRLSILNTNGDVLTSSSRNLRLKLAQAVPLSIVKITPEDEANDAEPNDFVTVFFNKPIDLNLLNIELYETVHGLSYVDLDPPGLDGLHAKGYELQEVNRDHEPVPGVFSLLPDNTTAVFYAQRDMAYNADIYATVTYDGKEMARRHFKVRPRPTIIDGFVVDNMAQAVAGIEVRIVELNRTAVTNKDGAYSLGYGDSADQNLPGGKYKITVNAGLKDRRLGSYNGYINIQAGTQNKMNNIVLPLLNKNVPFSYINSGSTNIINGNEMSLDATSASYVFIDGLNEGAIHMQFLPFGSIKQRPFKNEYTPIWAYGFQPAGIRVEGNLQIEFALPKFQGSYEYAPIEGELVILLGSNAENTSLVPIGVGETIAGNRIRSVGATHFQILDYIAYARVTPEQRADLVAYKSGELNIENLTLRLQTYIFVPPASEAEALQRGNAILGQ
jgi:hypothetical protein